MRNTEGGTVRKAAFSATHAAPNVPRRPYTSVRGILSLFPWHVAEDEGKSASFLASCEAGKEEEIRVFLNL